MCACACTHHDAHMDMHAHEHACKCLWIRCRVRVLVCVHNTTGYDQGTAIAGWSGMGGSWCRGRRRYCRSQAVPRPMCSNQRQDLGGLGTTPGFGKPAGAMSLSSWQPGWFFISEQRAAGGCGTSSRSGSQWNAARPRSSCWTWRPGSLCLLFAEVLRFEGIL